MKRLYFSYISIILLVGILYGIFGFRYLQSQGMREFHMIGNLAGAVLAQEPDLEETVIAAIQDTDYRYLDQGVDTLSKYGYDRLAFLADNPYYGHVRTQFAGLLALFLLSACALLTGGFLFVVKKYRTRQRRLLALLDDCLAENYDFLEQREEILKEMGDSFADTLFKLGSKLQLKTTALSEERDYTKTLVTDISHQLKTPMSALKNCFVMYVEADTKEEREEFLKRCKMQIDKLENLIAALINISRLETSLITLCPEETDLTGLLVEAVNTVYMKALSKKITIEVCGGEENARQPETHRLKLDKKWTAEAIANILDNAVKYSPEGSRIDIRVKRLYSHVCIEIEDGGIGISKNEYNQIFKRFYRGADPRVRDSEGSGVGLYLSRRIIEEQGGTIMVRPAPQQGSIFTVYLCL